MRANEIACAGAMTIARRCRAIVSLMSTEGDLEVWRLAMDLAVEAHRLSARLPAQERKSLADQLRRSASSVPANIAEGNARRRKREYLQFLSIAQGSMAELRCHLELAQRLGHVQPSELRLAFHYHERVGKMLTKLVKSISI